MLDIRWPGGPVPALRLEAHFGRVVPCFAERPVGLHALLAEAAARRPEGEALVCGDERLTWREVEARVAAIAGGLRARGIARGDRVAMLVGNRNEFVLSLFAIARLGAVAVPMGIRQQKPEIAYALSDCGALALIHDGDLASRVPDAAEVPALRTRIAIPDASGAEPFAALLEGPPCPSERVREDDTAVILYTSGTTGRPKGAMLTHLGIVHSAMVYEHCLGLRAEDRNVAAVPLSHVTGLIANVAVMARCGGTLVIMPEFKVRAFLPLASAERMTYALMVPAIYNLCLLQPDLADFDLSGWRVGGFGGAPMPPATISGIAERIPSLTLVNIYGSTETTSPTTLMPAGTMEGRIDRVGVATPGARVVVVDEEGRAVPPNTPGEIWIEGPHVVPGYWGNPEATRTGFVGGFWRSGDIGALDEEGFLRVLDRKKDMLNRGGHKIYTAEVEAVLAACPGVIESAVVGRPCPVLGERVHAIVVVREEGVTADAIRAFCAARLSDYKVPETYALGLDPLPRNSNGKVLKRELRESALAAGPA